MIFFMKSLCIVPCWNEDNRLSDLINQIKNFDQSKYLVDFLFIFDVLAEKLSTALGLDLMLIF